MVKKNCEIAIKTTQEELKTDYEAIDLMTKDKELPYKKYAYITAESTDEINLSDLFIGCNAFTIAFKNFDTSNVTDMNSMFLSCEKLEYLDLSIFDTSNVTDMAWMFDGCKSLKWMNIYFNTNKVTDMQYMFAKCFSVGSLHLTSFDTSNVTNMHGMFLCRQRLYSLDLSSFDFSKVTDAGSMFFECEALGDLKFGKNLKVSLDLSYSPLVHNSALSVLNGLANVEKQQVIKFSQVTYETLTDEDKKIATDKNWKIEIRRMA